MDSVVTTEKEALLLNFIREYLHELKSNLNILYETGSMRFENHFINSNIMELPPYVRLRKNLETWILLTNGWTDKDEHFFKMSLQARELLLRVAYSRKDITDMDNMMVCMEKLHTFFQRIECQNATFLIKNLLELLTRQTRYNATSTDLPHNKLSRIFIFPEVKKTGYMRRYPRNLAPETTFIPTSVQIQVCLEQLRCVFPDDIHPLFKILNELRTHVESVRGVWNQLYIEPRYILWKLEEDQEAR